MEPLKVLFILMRTYEYSLTSSSILVTSYWSQLHIELLGMYFTPTLQVITNSHKQSLSN